MKRNDLLRHLRKYGCYLKREGGLIPSGGILKPGSSRPYRHTEIPNRLAQRICRLLSIPELP